MAAARWTRSARSSPTWSARSVDLLDRAARPGPLERSVGHPPAFRPPPVVPRLPDDLLLDDPPGPEEADPVRDRASQEPRAVRAGGARVERRALGLGHRVRHRVYFSPRWKSQLGYEDHEISHQFREFESRLHPDDRERVLKTIEDYLGGPPPHYSVEFRMRCKDGSYRWILARGVVLRDSSRQPVPDGRLAHRHHRAEGIREQARRAEPASRTGHEGRTRDQRGPEASPGAHGPEREDGRAWARWWPASPTRSTTRWRSSPTTSRCSSAISTRSSSSCGSTSSAGTAARRREVPRWPAGSPRCAGTWRWTRP